MLCQKTNSAYHQEAISFFYAMDLSIKKNRSFLRHPPLSAIWQILLERVIDRCCRGALLICFLKGTPNRKFSQHAELKPVPQNLTWLIFVRKWVIQGLPANNSLTSLNPSNDYVFLRKEIPLVITIYTVFYQAVNEITRSQCISCDLEAISNTSWSWWQSVLLFCHCLKCITRNNNYSCVIHCVPDVVYTGKKTTRKMVENQ